MIKVQHLPEAKAVGGGGCRGVRHVRRRYSRGVGSGPGTPLRPVRPR